MTAHPLTDGLPNAHLRLSVFASVVPLVGNSIKDTSYLYKRVCPSNGNVLVLCNAFVKISGNPRF